MEVTIADLISIIGLLLGGGGLGVFFTWRYSRRKEKAEAEQAEVSVTKEMQDMYQQLIDDVKKDRDEQKAYIVELKDDRRHLREERDELRGRIDKMDEDVRELKRDVARYGRTVEMMRPFMCTKIDCRQRQRGGISENGVSEEPTKAKKAKKKTEGTEETKGSL
jgi:chromosome segregation ATPase